VKLRTRRFRGNAVGVAATTNGSWTEQTALVRQVLPYRSGGFFLRDLPPLRAVLAGVSGLSL